MTKKKKPVKKRRTNEKQVIAEFIPKELTIPTINGRSKEEFSFIVMDSSMILDVERVKNSIAEKSTLSAQNNRREGVSVNIRFAIEVILSPFQFCTEIDQCIGYRPRGRRLAKNLYRIFLRSESDRLMLLKLPLLCDKKFELSTEYCCLKGLIVGVPVFADGCTSYFTDTYLSICLRSSGVLSAKRIMRYPIDPETGQVVEQPTDRVIVTFKDFIPHHVLLGIKRYKVRNYVDHPPQCYRCQKLGHVSAHCKAPNSVCPFCAKTHAKRRCKSKTAQCANCEGPHPSTFAGCPVHKKYLAAAKLKIRRKLLDMSWKEALEAVKLQDCLVSIF